MLGAAPHRGNQRVVTSIGACTLGVSDLDGRGEATLAWDDTLAVAFAGALDNAGEPTLGEVHGDAFIYIANSPWSAFDESGARKPGTTLAAPEIRRLPLTP